MDRHTDHPGSFQHRRVRHNQDWQRISERWLRMFHSGWLPLLALRCRKRPVQFRNWHLLRLYPQEYTVYLLSDYSDIPSANWSGTSCRLPAESASLLLRQINCQRSWHLLPLGYPDLLRRLLSEFQYLSGICPCLSDVLHLLLISLSVYLLSADLRRLYHPKCIPYHLISS